MNTNFLLNKNNKSKFDLIEHKFNEIKQILNEIKSTSEVDLILLDGIQDVCENQIKKIVRIKHKIIQSTCNHEMIEDLIDITPDKSLMIKYCKHCEMCI